MSWDKRMAVNYAKTHAGSHSQGRCAEFTRKAIQAGGITLGHTYHAKDYGPMLRSAGFTAIGTYEMPREGDVIIIQPYAGGNPSGHMAICGPARATGQPGPHIPSTGRINENVLPCRAYPVAL